MKQLTKIIGYFKDLLKKQNRKKLVENAAIAILAGIIIMIAAGSFFKDDNNNKAKATAAAGTGVGEVPVENTASDEKEKMEKEMEVLLSKIEGAGEVSVMITYVSSSELVPASDTRKSENSTQEKDNAGGTRISNESQVESSIIFEEGEDSTKKPLIVKELEPEVKGVAVVADGASEAQVRERISRAVQVLLGVSMNKIEVLERNK